MYDLYPDNFRFNHVPHGHPRLIGLSGWATAGKDSVADVLTRLYGYERVSFADNLKAFVREVDPVVHPTVLGDEYPIDGIEGLRASHLVTSRGDTEAKKNREYRRLLQAVGTKAREFFGEDVWVNAAFRTLEDGQYVISDCRFKNEAKAIQDRGGLVLRVMRPGVEAVNDHISEHDLDDWAFDGYVMNDGSLLDLEGEVQRVLGDLG